MKSFLPPANVSVMDNDRTSATWQRWFQEIGVRLGLLQPVYSGTLADLPKTLKEIDAGTIYEATDVAHRFIWNGGAWQFAPGDPGSAFVVTGTPAGTAPHGGAWSASDGTTAVLTKSDGTTETVTTTVIANGWIRR